MGKYLHTMLRCILKLWQRIAYSLIYWCEKFKHEASGICKICTTIAFILLLVFIGINGYEKVLNAQAEEVITKNADLVIDSSIKQINEMDITNQESFEPFREFLLSLKIIGIYVATLSATLIIGIYISYLKMPFEMIKKLTRVILENIDGEPWTWIPFCIIGAIDLIELVRNFI